ncbi:hypothetical protein BGZ60DRAFT_379045 [Tricladium varicosporioides]|nr:hypothetical protein BGZ60DRAFT_379045 [Hymenoscyphus varicosporioides]
MQLCDGGCQGIKRVYHCVQCDGAFCDECWAKQFPHRPGKLGADGLPHEKTDPEVVERLRDTLDNPDRTPEEQEKLHKNDEDTTWFGIGRDEANMPIFQDYGRYAAILAEPQDINRRNRYPQLVSFIGQTGAGKSTLIKILIDKEKGAKVRPDGLAFSSPITSLANNNLPTSGDVHLYSDPTTYGEQCPIMYADCEGLEGGENVPQGAKFKQKDGVATPSPLYQNPSHNSHYRKKIRKRNGNPVRDLVWAVDADTQRREFAVTQLYPRLLYTFSDTVVYVLKNSKAFESAVLEKLLKWASASIEKSVNQPTLPHLIIVLNASEVVPNEAQWNVEQATKTLMADVALAVERDPRIRVYVREWKERGARIQTTQDLLRCFYSSITVIRIPIKGRYMLLEDQVTKLRKEILRCCQDSLETKKQARMLANGEKLQIYLQSAFDHFSQDLDTPFDFVKEAIKINPLPRDFCGNIIKLAIAIKDYSHFKERADIPRIFQELSHMVGSCIVLDSIRQGLPGTPVTLFKNYYRAPCIEALESFSKSYWPCSFQHKNERCTLVMAGHGPKGHQRADGRILAPGYFEANFDIAKSVRDWNDNLILSIGNMQRKLERKRLHQSGLDKPYDDEDEQAAVSELHNSQMKTFFDHIGNVDNFISHLACFSCLRELPEHPLPCGHVLCTPCVEACGRRSGKSTILLESCPLHSTATTWVTPWEINIKPQYAGARILSLDGGGVRGIVELEVLKAIEMELGGNLDIRAFFDLIVGTSTGGIIALGLGVQNWSVDDCIEKFVRLCKKAFVPQRGLNVWGLGYITTLVHKGKYRTKPFVKALQDQFGEEMSLFGGQNRRDQFKIKVVVTSTTNVESEPLILTNYNRPEPNKPQYRFERSDHPRKELKIWEAARATSAAPPYFKHFTNPHTNQGYLDGAFYHNNPIWVAFREHQLIWSDVGSLHPDILLSVGTGCCTSSPVPSGPTKARDPKTYTEQIWGIVDSSIKHMLNCDRRWEQFCDVMIRPGSEGTPRQYIRANPELSFPVPALDDIESVPKLRQEVQKIMKRPKNKEWLRDMAYRLVASTFFFEKDHVSIREEEDQFACKGRICCRFSNSSERMKELGKYLHGFLKPNFLPYFFVCEPKKYSFETSKMIPLTRPIINNMWTYGAFDAVNIDIKASGLDAETMILLCLKEGDFRRTYSMDVDYDPNKFDDIPISGFPRKLMIEDSLAS